MKKEILETIMDWANDPILDSVNFKSITTCNEDGTQVLYAKFHFVCNDNKVEIEKRIPMFEIEVNDLKAQLYGIDDILNINEISKLKN